MKPWGSQLTFRTVFQSGTHRCQSANVRSQSESPPCRSSRATEKMASGGPGGGNEPLVAVRMPRNLGTDGCSSSPYLLPWSSKSWVAIDYASCGAASGRPPPQGAGGNTGPITPAQLSQYARRPFVTDSLQGQSSAPWDSPSFELTRRFPQRTTSAIKSQENLHTPRRPFVTDSVRAT